MALKGRKVGLLKRRVRSHLAGGESKHARCCGARHFSMFNFCNPYSALCFVKCENESRVSQRQGRLSTCLRLQVQLQLQQLQQLHNTTLQLQLQVRLYTALQPTRLQLQLHLQYATITTAATTTLYSNNNYNYTITQH